MRLTREQLYAVVWVERMTHVAKRYEVSSSLLARVCERLNVPRPTRRYWAKLRHGIEMEQPPLPEPGLCDELRRLHEQALLKDLDRTVSHWAAGRTVREFLGQLECAVPVMHGLRRFRLRLRGLPGGRKTPTR